MISTCLFPVAGYGSRFLPASKAVPKEMLPILEKPLIQYAVEEAFSAGITTMSFITGRNKAAIENHFDHNPELTAMLAAKESNPLAELDTLIKQAEFTYLRQGEMKGLGHAVGLGRHLLAGDDAFAVMLPDDLCVNDTSEVLFGVIAQLKAYYQIYRCPIIAVEEVPLDRVSDYGVIDGEELTDGVYSVNSLVEKPHPEAAPSNLAVIGRYILTPSIFSVLDDTPPGRNGEVQLTDALSTMASTGQVIAVKFKGQRFDCGRVDGFMAANNYHYDALQRA